MAWFAPPWWRSEWWLQQGWQASASASAIITFSSAALARAIRRAGGGATILFSASLAPKRARRASAAVTLTFSTASLGRRLRYAGAAVSVPISVGLAAGRRRYAIGECTILFSGGMFSRAIKRAASSAAVVFHAELSPQAGPPPPAFAVLPDGAVVAVRPRQTLIRAQRIRTSVVIPSRFGG